MAFTPAQREDFVSIIRQHGVIKRRALLFKMHTAGHPDISDVNLRQLKAEINLNTDDILLGSDRRGYFLVNDVDTYERDIMQIQNQALDLLEKKSLAEKKFKRLYPAEYSKMLGQLRLALK